MLGFLTTASIMAMNEANANGVAPGYRSVLENEELRKVSQSAKIWGESLEHAFRPQTCLTTEHRQQLALPHHPCQHGAVQTLSQPKCRPSQTGCCT